MSRKTTMERCSRVRRVLRKIIELINTILHPFFSYLRRDEIRILLYHRVCDLPTTNDVMDTLSVTPQVFEKQMHMLYHRGYNALTLDELIVYKDKDIKPPSKTIVITFDDGYRDNFLNAFPLLEKYGYKGTFFITAEYIDSNSVFPWLKLGETSLNHMSENLDQWIALKRSDIITIVECGVCIGSHTMSHPHLSSMDDNAISKELSHSKQVLEEIISKPVYCFAYPYGDWDENVKNQVNIAGYRAAVTVANTSNTLKSDFLKLGRIQIFNNYSMSKFIREVEGTYDLIELFELLIIYIYNYGRTLKKSIGRE